MGQRVPVVQHSLGGGELDPQLQARSDTEVFARTCERLENFVVDNSGQARYRQGTAFVDATFGSPLPEPVFMEPFVFSTLQAYVLAFGNLTMRVMKDSGVVLESPITIIAATDSAGSIQLQTSAPHGYTTPNYVQIDGMLGYTALNGRTFRINGAAAADLFSIADVYTNVNIPSTGFASYTGGGTVTRVYTMATPYGTANVPNLVMAQASDTGYITCPTFQPRKLTRTGHAAWNIAAVSFIDGPYFPENITSATMTPSGGAYTPGSVPPVTASVATFAVTDVGRLFRIWNGTKYAWGTITSYTSTTAVTVTVKGSENFPNTAQTRWNLGAFSDTLGWPQLVELYGQKLQYANTTTFPQTVFGSRSAEVNADYDTFGAAVNGTVLDTDPFTFRVAGAKGNPIRCIKGTDLFLFVGTYGSEHKMDGGSPGSVITPTSVNILPFSFFGVGTAQPVVADNNVMYTRRNRTTLQSTLYDPFRSGYLSDDKTIFASHINRGYVKKMAFQSGPPDIMWEVLDTGQLRGMTYQQTQQVLAWHRHPFAPGVTCEDICTIPQPAGPDQLWLQLKLVHPTTGATTRVFTYMQEQVVYPERTDYNLTVVADDATDAVREAARAADDELYYRALFEAQKQSTHLDAMLTYDGSDYGLGATLSVTPGTGANVVATTGVVFVGTAGTFTASMVGREIWKKGSAGRAVITGYTDSSHVACTIREAFDSLDVMAPGAWYLTTSHVTGAYHLEGWEVGLLLDGGDGGRATVVNAGVTLQNQVSVAQLGIPYRGLVVSNILAGRANDNSDEGRTKTISEVSAFLYNTGSCQAGCDFYRLEAMALRPSNAAAGRPSPLFTGWKEVANYQNSSTEPRLIFKQEKPEPCIIQAVRATSDASAP